MGEELDRKFIGLLRPMFRPLPEFQQYNTLHGTSRLFFQGISTMFSQNLLIKAQLVRGRRTTLLYFSLFADYSGNL